MSNSKIFKKNILSVDEMNQAEIYQYATDSSSIVSITDEKGKIIHVNEAFCSISGFTEEELIGQDHRLINSGHHPSSFFKEMWECLQSGKPWKGDVCNRTKDGDFYWVATNITPIWDKSGSNFQYISIRSDISERKRYEFKMLEEKNTLNFVLESSKAAMFQLNIESGYLDCGSTFLGILGLSSYDIKNNFENFLSYIHQDDIKKFRVKLKAHFNDHLQSFNSLFNFVRPDGQVLHLLCRGKVIRKNSEGKSSIFVGTITDFSEQLALEDLLKRTQEVAQVGSWEYNVKKDKLFWSDLVYQIHGYSPSAFIPTIESGINFYAPEHKELIAAEVEKALMTGGSWDLELKIIHASGSEVWVRAVGQCEILNGEPVRVFGTFQDIEQRKQIEIALSESKQQLDLALESAGIGLWQYYPARDELIWDEFMHQLFDVNLEDFKGDFSCWQNCLLPEDLIATSEIFACCIERQEPLYNASFRIRTKEGGLRYIQARAKIEYDQEGIPTRLLGLNWDISKEKEFQSYLIEARDKAQEATKAKSVFLASMSHEIRTPMNGVLGMLELLSETQLNEEQRDLVSTIKNCSDDLLDIVNDVLDFSKIEAGKLEIEDRAFSLKELLKQLEMIFEIAAKKKGIEINFAFDSDLPEFIVSDMVRLKQVLTNLLANALKFTSKGSVSLIVEVNQDLKTSNRCQLDFRVKDTGIGVPASKLGKLFESFSQVDDSTTRRFGGSGLGLAISKSLVEKMGGVIKVESIENKGSTFSFSILAGIEESANLKPIAEVQSDYRRDIKVLVAEDNLTNQKLVIRFFDKIGVKLDLASDGLEVMELVKTNKYDLIFMDVQMPNMDGITATKLLCEKYGSDIPKIIAMTANVFKEDQQRCFDAGMIDFLGKPVSKKNIKNILGKYFPLEGSAPIITNNEDMMSDALIDEKQILFEFKEDFDIFCELVDDYKAGYIKMLKEIDDAIVKKDFQTLRVVAHTLKGVSSNFYSKPLTEAAFKLEKMGEDEVSDGVTEASVILKDYNTKVLAELDVFVKENSSLLDDEVA
jgi:PAS domain S-box-containing protein